MFCSTKHLFHKTNVLFYKTNVLFLDTLVLKCNFFRRPKKLSIWIIRFGTPFPFHISSCTSKKRKTSQRATFRKGQAATRFSFEQRLEAVPKFYFSFAPSGNQNLMPGGRKRSESAKKPVKALVGWGLSGPPRSPLAREPVPQKAKLRRLPGSASSSPSWEMKTFWQPRWLEGNKKKCSRWRKI